MIRESVRGALRQVHRFTSDLAEALEAYSLPETLEGVECDLDDPDDLRSLRVFVSYPRSFVLDVDVSSVGAVATVNGAAPRRIPLELAESLDTITSLILCDCEPNSPDR